MPHDLEFDQDAPAWQAPVAARSILLVFWHRKAFVLLGAFLGLALGFLWHTQRAPVYQSSCQIVVIKKRAQDVLPVPGDPRPGLVEDYMATHLAYLRSPIIIERAVKKRDLGTLKTFENVGDPSAAILGGLVVARDNKDTGALSNIIVLTYRGPVAEDCGKVLAAILESYQEFLNITYSNASDEALRLITNARDTLKRDLTDAEEKQTKFRQSSPLFFRNKDGLNVEQERVATAESKRSQLLLRQTELRDRIRALETAIKDGKAQDILPALQVGTVGPDGKNLNSEKYVEEPILPLLVAEQQLLEQFGEDHYQVKSIRKRIEMTRAHLKKLSPQGTEKDPAKRALLAFQYELGETELTLRSVGELVEKWKTDAKNLSNEEIQETHLRNDVKRHTDIYEATIGLLQKINLVRESDGGFDARPLSTPGIGVKVAPIAWQDVSMGLMVGLLLGAGLAYLAELSDKSFRDPEEIRRRLGLPLVGHIPFLMADADAERKRAAGETTLDPLLCTHFRAKSLESEAYRAVRTALFFATQGLGHKVIQVTSPNKGDGKSLMIANLAVMVAQSGKRVLLIDGDLRRPRQHKIFGLDTARGLATVLDGAAEAGDLVQPTGVANLWLLPSGAVPPNPSELLISPRFNALLEAARLDYDYVLVDTPPLLAVTDPCVVAGRVDGVFLTIRLTRKGRPDAERAREILAGLGVKIFGVVVNGLSRGSGGIYSPNAYDYTDNYEQDDNHPEGDYYYYAEDDASPDRAGTPARSPELTAAARHGHGSTSAHGKKEAKGFWQRWWPRA
jgi:succinoglycan biosynthesis transport protein ExoP